ncbi:MAG: GtrA family protein [Ruminococcus sp.]|uniref:GtrA family protein n=1 Tax=Ruminococcus sp. TaxID=41978 RepID=UPI002931D7A5|nr:GtrA family protein [uncultured Ruminococcus sp.]MBQ1474858.1 GtrA family protein [Ruminococcus sp.]MBQ4238083.1 GtrA family protein [Ruminococcus sp.]
MNNKKKELIRSLKFVLFSISAGVIQIVSFTLLTEFTGLSYWPCYLISLVLSVLYNFTINRKFTFHSAANVPIAMLKVFLYYLVFTPLSTIGGNFLVESLGWNEYLVELLSMLLNFITEFLFTRFVVYGKQIDNDEKYIEKESKKTKKKLEQLSDDINEV